MKQRIALVTGSLMICAGMLSGATPESCWPSDLAGGQSGAWMLCDDGTVMKAPDAGKGWTLVRQGGKGQSRAITVTGDGTIVVGGASGLERSGDGGATWQAAKAPADVSINALAAAGSSIWHSQPSPARRWKECTFSTKSGAGPSAGWAQFFTRGMVDEVGNRCRRD